MLRPGSELHPAAGSNDPSVHAVDRVPLGNHQLASGAAADAFARSDPQAKRRTPRVSLIVILPENHIVSPDSLAERLRPSDDQDVDVVVACAGQPTNLTALQRSIGEAQFLLAPAGTSIEDLRELAMRQSGGDIVTLVNGAQIPAASVESSLVMTS
ncbi:MAG TPA: hypothetical protein VGG76_08435 [Gemmatimonadaceae bacterium]|jgi:hypothetical protein